MFPTAQQMAAPFCKAFNDSIFVKKGHADHLKWVSDSQSSKKLGQKDADDDPRQVKPPGSNPMTGTG